MTKVKKLFVQGEKGLGLGLGLGLAATQLAVVPLIPEIPVNPSKPQPSRILATIQRGGGPVEVIAVDDDSVELS